MCTKSYKFFNDPFHGWLRVKISELTKLNLMNQISKYSYIKGKYAYLEEAYDAPKFIKAKTAIQQKPVIIDSYSTKLSPIRTYDNFIL